MAVDEIEPVFRESPALKGLLRLGRGDGRNTLTRKSLAGGGSIKILSAMAPSNLRRHDCALLCADEVDGYKVTPEGDALALAERRTMAQPHPKIVCCSTPVDEDTSVITQRYSEGSQEIFEVPCPRCGAFNEIEWSHMEWENHDPETVKYLCPHCKELIPERLKPTMVEGGRWRALKPEVIKINALVSLLPQASWPKLVAMYLEAKRGGPSVSKVFRNTILGLPWRTTINRVDASILADRAEPWGLETPHHGVIIPDPVMLITCGVDTQDDRLEAVVIGFPIFGAPCILGHVVFAGNTLEDDVWRDLDRFLKTRWRHSRGWQIGIDGTAIDSGGREGRTQKVYDFCYPRMMRRIFAIKGLPGPRKVWTKLTSVKGDMRAFGVAVDVIGLDGAEDAQAFRFSDQLGDDYFVQVTNEVPAPFRRWPTSPFFIFSYRCSSRGEECRF